MEEEEEDVVSDSGAIFQGDAVCVPMDYLCKEEAAHEAVSRLCGKVGIYFFYFFFFKKKAKRRQSALGAF